MGPKKIKIRAVVVDGASYHWRVRREGEYLVLSLTPERGTEHALVVSVRGIEQLRPEHVCDIVQQARSKVWGKSPSARVWFVKGELLLSPPSAVA